MQQFLSVKDVANPLQLAQEGLALKKNPLLNSTIGKNKTLVVLFFNPSLRTRLSTQVAAQNIGMNVITLDADSGWQLETKDFAIMNSDKAEHIKEAAGVISQYADIIGVRTFPSLTDKEKDYQEHILSQLVRYATVPVVSLESATRHPLQSLADLMTIQEYDTVKRPKVVLSWAPHVRRLPQAVPNSFAEWILAANIDLTIAQPKGYELAEEFTRGATISYDQDSAFQDADFIYAKNWSSYNDYGKITDAHNDWLITTTKMQLTNKARLMHCLPVRRNIVVTDEVLDSEAAIILPQAKNRLFAAQIVLQKIIEQL